MWSRFVVAAMMLVAGAVCALTPVSCKTSCSDGAGDLPDELHEGGEIDAERAAFASGPWNGAFLEFKPQKTYIFRHCLQSNGKPGVPNLVQVYVGFKEQPLGPDRSVSEAAGNEAIVEEVNERWIVVRNDTCQRFYVRVAASDPLPPVGGTEASASEGPPESDEDYELACQKFIAEAAARSSTGSGDAGQGGAPNPGEGGAAGQAGAAP